MSNNNYEVNVYSLSGERSFVDNLAGETAEINVRELFYKEDGVFTKAQKKYLLQVSAPGGEAETIVTNRFTLILNSVIQELANKLEADIEIEYWRGNFSGKVVGKEMTISVTNSYIKNSAFRLWPCIDVELLGKRTDVALPLSFARSHLGKESSFEAFFDNAIFLTQKVLEHRSAVENEINRPVQKDLYELIEKACEKSFPRKVSAAFKEFKPETYAQLIHFFSELHAYIDNLKPSARLQVLRKQVLDDIFLSMDVVQSLRQILKDNLTKDTPVVPEMASRKLPKIASPRKKKIL